MNKGSGLIPFRGTVLMAAAMCAFGPAVSAAADNEEAANGASASGLDEIVVTARRREEKLQSVPIAITAMTQETLRENNIQSVGDLQFYVPSLSATGQRRDSMGLSIRGQGSSSYSALPGVIVYVNEVPIPVDNLGQTPSGPGLFYDLENAQVLKGPQGTLFGRNAIGGAILLQSKRPTNDVGGAVEVAYGNYNDREVQATFNAPIVNDTVLFRVAIKGQQRDGFTHSLGDPTHPNGKWLDDINFLSTRATLTIRPNENFQNDLIAQTYSSATNGSSVLLDSVDPTGVAATVFPQLVTIFAQQQALGIRTQVPLDTSYFADNQDLYLTDIMRANLSSDLVMRNIIGFRQARSSYAIDFDASTVPLLDFGHADNFLFRQFSEEPQLLGKAFGERLDWILGGFYMTSPPQDYAGNNPQTVSGTTSVNQNRFGDTSKALYAQGTYDLSAWLTGLKATAGFRYTWDARSLQTRLLSADHTCAGTDLNPDTACTISNSGKWTAPTWTLGLDYQVTSQTLVYVASRRGYRGGGFNAGVADPNLENFAPETVTDEELGIKTDLNLAGMPLRINAAAFHQAYDQIQVNRFVFDAAAGTIVSVAQNAATARLWGAELEAWLHVTTGLQLGVNFDWVDLKYTSFAAGVDPAPLIGLEKYNRPPYKYGVNARYSLPVNDKLGDVSVNASWNWQATSGDTTDRFAQIPQFALLSFGGNWDKVAGGPIDLSVFMTNALNKTYLVQAQSLYGLGLGYADATYGEPRMFGVRLRYRFGSEK